MIDLAKYDGHLASEGQTWAWSNWMLNNAETNEQHKATSALLNDAPLLLAEVERLHLLSVAYREEIERLREEVKMLWQYVDTEQMYNDGLLTVEGEMIE